MRTPTPQQKTKIRAKTTTFEEYEDSKPYFNFINSIKAPETKRTYKIALVLFWKHCRLTSTSSLMAMTSEELRDKIIGYFLENKHISRNTQRVRLATIKHFCEMNDIVLNWKKIGKFVNSEVPKLEGQGYEHEQIKQLIDYSDHRISACFLFLA
jgi:hypothetical protein